MIDQVLSFIVAELDAALQRQYPGDQPHAIMAGLAGARAAGSENRIVFSLVNLAQEDGARAQPPGRGAEAPFARVELPRINLFILVAAVYDDYRRALEVLTSTLAFFQSRPIFTPADARAFPPGVDKLTIEFVDLSLQDLNSIWTIRGAAYQPSFVLKLRMPPIGPRGIAAPAPGTMG